LLNLAINTYTF